MSSTTNNISITELSAFTGGNDYPKAWEKIHSGQSFYAGFNIFALIGGPVWFFYRKMYVTGVLLVLAEQLMWYFHSTQNLLAPFITLFFVTYKLLLGLLSNAFYYSKAVKTIQKIDALNTNNERHLQLITKAGGVSFLSALIVVMAYQVFIAFFKAT